MRVLVVFESLFGNTRQIAQAIADGAQSAGPQVEASCVRVSDVAGIGAGDVDLIFVGGPTQFHGMASRRKRDVWLRQQDLAAGSSRSGRSLEPGIDGPFLSEWLDRLAQERSGTMAVAFDTRLDRAFSGGAAPKIERQLRARGYRIVAKAMGFIAEDMEGPLRSGELERAATWSRLTVERLLHP